MHIKISQMSFFFIVILLVGCSKSEDQVLQEADETANRVFTEESSVEANYTDESLSFYLPKYLHIIDQDENNIILESKENTYVIFINHLEEPISRLHFESASNDSSLLYNSFERDDMFGYIRVLQAIDAEDQFELQVGIGGVKITTYTVLKQINRETEELMKIAKSIIESNC